MARVALAYVHSTAVSHCWFASYGQFWRHDISRAGHVFRGGAEIGIQLGTAAGLPHARNEGVRQMLEEDWLEWLLWVDTDMGFPPDGLDRLLEAADPLKRPVVGGLCFALRSAGEDGLGGQHQIPFPTIYEWDAREKQYRSRVDYERYPEVQPCDGTGSAFILIHRSVFEAMPANSWYAQVPAGPDGSTIGEDLSFCVRCREIGIPIHVHRSVETSHHKQLYVGSAIFRAFRLGWTDPGERDEPEPARAAQA